MTLTGKFLGLTSGQREKFYTLKDSVGLEAFLSETGFELTVEEKAQVLEYIASGKLPLADEELDNVAGGGCGSGKKCPQGRTYYDTLSETCKNCPDRPGGMLRACKYFD